MTSTSIGAIADALAKAQGEMSAASKDALNPHFKSRYADLASIMDSIRGPLSKNGLAVAQFVGPTENPGFVSVETRLLHSSGEWLHSECVLPVSKQDAQGYGSAITYGRRYGLAALVGAVADDDDDGNAASGRGDNQNAASGNRQPVGVGGPSKGHAEPPPHSTNGNGHKPTASPQWLGFRKELEELLEISPEVFPSMDAIKAEVVEIAKAYKIDPATMATAATVDQVGNLLKSLKARGNARLEKLAKEKAEPEYSGVV